MAEATNILSINRQVAQLIALERQPVITLKTQRGDIDTKRGAFSDLSSKLSKLRSSAQTLADTVTTVFNTSKVTSSNKDVLTATTNTKASLANHSVVVSALATNQAVSSSSLIGSASGLSDGSFNITTADGTTKTITVTGITGANNSTALASIAAAINSSGLKIGASVVTTDAGSGTQKLVLTSNSTGVAGMATKITTSALSTALGIDNGGADANLGVLSTVRTGTATAISTAVGAGTKLFTITTSTSSKQFSVAVGASDSDSTVLSNMAAAINADTTINVSAAVVTDGTTSTNQRLVLTSGNTTSTITSIVDDTGTLAATAGITGVATVVSKVTQQAGDASFTLDGNAVSSATNVNSTAITGITLSLLGTSATAVNLTIESDVAEVKKKVQTFLDDYNAVLTFLKSKTGVDPATKIRGILAGESTYSVLGSTLRGILSGQITGITTGNPTYVSEIGITAARDGSLSITDSKKFEDTLKSDPSKVSKLFSDPSFDDDTATFVGGIPTTGGFANKIDEFVESFVKAGGLISGTKKILDDRIKFMDEQIKRFEDRLKIREKVLTKQFSAIFEALSLLSSQQQVVSRFS